MCACDILRKMNSPIILPKLFSYVMSLWLLKSQSQMFDSFVVGILLCHSFLEIVEPDPVFL